MLVKLDDGLWILAENVKTIGTSSYVSGFIVQVYDRDDGSHYYPVKCSSEDEAKIKANEIAERVNEALSCGSVIAGRLPNEPNYGPTLHPKILELAKRMAKAWKNEVDMNGPSSDEIRNLVAEARNLGLLEEV